MREHSSSDFNAHMRRAAAALLLSVLCALGCETKRTVVQLSPESLALIAINDVLQQRWLKGIMTEDIDLYMSSYWADGFVYIADLGTPHPDDDVIYDDIAQEREAMIRIFDRYRVEMDIEFPSSALSLNDENTRYEARSRYEFYIKLEAGTLEGGHTGGKGSGENQFIFEERLNPETNQLEWRIVEYYDYGDSPEDSEDVE